VIHTNIRGGVTVLELEEITRWRIDYNLVSDSLQHKLKRAVILSDAVHSDHCPILVELNFLILKQQRKP
jgi:endonuclease/exonuclease/phosphatase (EEP) superfamily protein YafD